jgi:hypothetical protein
MLGMEYQFKIDDADKFCGDLGDEKPSLSPPCGVA